MRMSDLKLDEIEQELKKLDPELDPLGPAFQSAVVLMAAAFVTGPNLAHLAFFTGYPYGFVSKISQRMHLAHLWENGEAKSDHWFHGDQWALGFWTDTLVAEGLMVTRIRRDGKLEYGCEQSTLPKE